MHDMNIQIRHAELRDAAAMRDIHSQIESIWGTLQIPYPTEEAWKKRLETFPEGSACLVAEVDGKVIGSAAIMCRNKSPRRRHVGEIGMAVDREWARKGVGSALLKALIDMGEKWLNLSRIELTVFVDNQAAISLYKKFGFEVEGTHKNYAFRDGKYADCHSMAKIRQ